MPPFAPPGPRVQTRCVPPPSDQDERPVRPSQPTHAATGADLELRLVLGANWVAPSLARERGEGWLRAHRRPPAQAEELALADSGAGRHTGQSGPRVPLDGGGQPGAG